MALRIEPTVTLVNRLRDENGDPVTQDFMFDGELVQIIDRLTVPYGIGRILAHHSMKKLDLVTMRGSEYSLGCLEFGLPESPITVTDGEVQELVDRNLLPYRKRVESRRLHNPIMRHDPMSVTNIGEKDGAFPGGFGNTVSRSTP